MNPEEQLAALRATMLGQAIEAHQVTGPAATQLTRLWADDFTLSTDSAGRYQLLTKVGEPAADCIKGRLASPEWAHFTPRDAATTTPEAKQAELVDRARAYAGLPSLQTRDFVPLGG